MQKDDLKWVQMDTGNAICVVKLSGLFVMIFSYLYSIFGGDVAMYELRS